MVFADLTIQISATNQEVHAHWRERASPLISPLLSLKDEHMVTQDAEEGDFWNLCVRPDLLRAFVGAASSKLLAHPFADVAFRSYIGFAAQFTPVCEREWMIYYHSAAPSTPRTAMPIEDAPHLVSARESRRFPVAERQRLAGLARDCRNDFRSKFPEHEHALAGPALAHALGLVRRHVALFVCQQYGPQRAARKAPRQYVDALHEFLRRHPCLRSDVPGSLSSAFDVTLYLISVSRPLSALLDDFDLFASDGVLKSAVDLFDSTTDAFLRAALCERERALAAPAGTLGR